MSSSLLFSLIVSDDDSRLVTAVSTIDIATMKRDARPLTMPRTIAIAESKAAMAPLANPITKSLTGWRSRLKGENAESMNAMMDGKTVKEVSRVRPAVPS